MQRLPSIADEAPTAAIGPEADARFQQASYINVQTQDPNRIAGTAERGRPPLQATTMAQAACLSAPKFRPLFDEASN